MKTIRTIAAVTVMVLTAVAVRPVSAADELAKVLSRLDEESQHFKSASADIAWDNVQVAPIPDTDRQMGTVIFERKGGEVQMALHLKTENGKPIHKDLVYAGGTGKLYDALLKQMQVFQVGSKRGELNTFLTLGFGGSGKDLAKSWNVTYQGVEAVNGVQAAKLQLVPRDAEMAKTAPKVLLWVDVNRGVAVKQQRFDPAGNYGGFTYTDIKLNGSVPGNAFELKPPSGTQIVNH